MMTVLALFGALCVAYVIVHAIVSVVKQWNGPPRPSVPVDEPAPAPPELRLIQGGAR